MLGKTLQEINTPEEILQKGACKKSRYDLRKCCILDPAIWRSTLMVILDKYQCWETNSRNSECRKEFLETQRWRFKIQMLYPTSRISQYRDRCSWWFSKKIHGGKPTLAFQSAERSLLKDKGRESIYECYISHPTSCNMEIDAQGKSRWKSMVGNCWNRKLVWKYDLKRNW